MRSRLNQSGPARLERKWTRLAVVWALYYFLAWTLGQDPRFTRQIIWFGAGLVGVFTVPLFARHVRWRDLPREGVLLGLFVLWGLTGLFVATDLTLFSRCLKLTAELALIVIAVSIILKNSGAGHWFFLAYLGVAAVRVFYGAEPVSMERITDTEIVSRIDNANTIGFLCALGVLGAFALWGERSALWWRAGLVAGGGLALYGVVLSASRGAFATLIAIALLWPAMCLVGASKFKLKTLVAALATLIVAFHVYRFVVQETYMGVRFISGTQLEDGSSQTRLQLFLIGLKLFAENPVFGCGLGQFGVASGTGFYAHNEVAEIASTTGLPGLLLYYSVYWGAWRRLSWSLRYLPDPLTRYRINVARMALLVLLISGALTRPNFFAQNTMFLLGISVGMAHWAERLAKQVHRPAGWPPAGVAGSVGFPPPAHGAFP